MKLRILVLMFVVALVGAACASPSSSDDGAEAPAEVSEATHDDEAAHDDGETGHDDEAAHDDAKTAHDDEAAHDAAETAHDDDEPVAAGDADRVIAVEMTELEFSPVEYEVFAGETIRFEVTNEGLIEHEFRLSNTHRIEEHIAAGHADHDAEGGHHEDIDIVLLVQSGESGDVTFTFPEDTTLFNEIACLLPGHYEAGMKGSIIYASA
jgi:uncharacterized cupredoxin-like copper-binding protein